MTLYLLTASIDHEGEEPLLIAATLEEVKAAAQIPYPGATFSGDELRIYEAEPGTKPELIAYAYVQSRWDRVKGRNIYTLADWSPA